MSKEFSILLNVSVNAKYVYSRTEYYVHFKGWKYGVVSGKNQINMKDLNITDAYSRWSENEFIELGKVLRDAAVEMMKDELQQ